MCAWKLGAPDELKTVHLFSVDDTIFFGMASWPRLEAIQISGSTAIVPCPALGIYIKREREMDTSTELGPGDCELSTLAA